MKNRIKQIRKEHQLTQIEFGKKIGVKGNTITNYENGLRNPTDAVLLAICREFNVNEEWLRTGKGEPAANRTRNQEIGAFMNDVMDLPDEAFKKCFIEKFSRLNKRDWEDIQRIVEKLLKEGD